nr:MAG TPA_asm: hypothetical protein [Caudoviricetes sp.]
MMTIYTAAYSTEQMQHLLSYTYYTTHYRY